MARPKAADPVATRGAILAAARALAVENGLASLSARTIAADAGVSATTVCQAFSSITNLRCILVSLAFDPLISCCEVEEEMHAPRTFDIVLAALCGRSDLPALAVQALGYAGRRQGTDRPVALAFDRCWTMTREHLVKPQELGRLLVGLEAPPTDVADRMIRLYFTVAARLVIEPKLDPLQLRTLFRGTSDPLRRPAIKTQ